MFFHFLEQGAVVGCSVGVDDVEDALATDNEAVTEALSFGGAFTRLEVGVLILASVVAGEITDDVRGWRLGKNEGTGVVRLEFLQSGCKKRQGYTARQQQGELTEK